VGDVLPISRSQREPFQGPLYTRPRQGDEPQALLGTALFFINALQVEKVKRLRAERVAFILCMALLALMYFSLLVYELAR
jgi:hypothetical protein